MASANKEFDMGPGGRPRIMSEKFVYFDTPQSIITLHPLTVTLVTITEAIAFLGDRAALTSTGMAAATDGANHWEGVAGIRPQASKAIEFMWTVRAVTFADPQFVMGLGVVATTQTAKVLNATGGDQTDYLLLCKDTGTNNLSLRARKASGTKETQTVSATPMGTVDATWLRFHMVLTRDPDTAGRGKIRLYGGADSLQIVPLLAEMNVATQFADTVSMAGGFGWLSGANNTALSIGYYGRRIYN